MYLPTTYILTYLLTYFYIYTPTILLSVAFLAQSVERAAFNRKVVGSSPTGGVFYSMYDIIYYVFILLFLFILYFLLLLKNLNNISFFFFIF